MKIATPEQLPVDDADINTTSDSTLTGMEDSSQTVLEYPKTERRRRKSRELRRLERKLTRLKRTWLVGGTLLGLLLIGSFTSLQTAKSQLAESSNSVRSLTSQMSTLQTEVEKLRTVNQDLLKGQLPGLKPVEFGTAVNPGAPLVKSLMITESRHDQSRSYQYMAVLKNTQREPVEPNVKIYLFNGKGIQISKSEITTLGNENEEDSRLFPGESHAVSAKLPLESNDIPKYYLVRSE
ncbi:MAG: hypothetical protein ACWA5X_12390 [bacterium]